MKIAMVDNLSARGYYLSPPPEGASVHFATPSGVCRAVADGACDAALLPAAWLPKMNGFEEIGNYGIACRGAVRSVVFFSHLPVASIISAGLPVHVTPASQTSARLFALLAARRFGRSPVYVGADKCAAGSLLIGDEAVAAAVAHAWPHTCDLSAWWNEATGLPFVFARWVVRSDASAWQRARLSMWLESCCSAAESLEGQRALASTWQGPPAWRLQATAYYEQLRLRLGDFELRGLHKFLNALEVPAPWCKSA